MDLGALTRLAGWVRPAPPHPAPEAETWTDSRLGAEEELWGEGYLMPGGGAEVLRLAAPLGLSAASVLLLVGAGAGGAACTLAGTRGVWVTAFESDPELAARAARRIQRAGVALAKRATAQRWDRAAPWFGRQCFDHALAFDAVRDGPPAPVLTAIATALRPGGRMVLVEIVADSPPEGDADLALWCRLEGRPAHLPTEAEVTEALEALGFRARVEDISARHIQLACAGWTRLARGVAAFGPTPGHQAALRTEAELWACQMRLMRHGTVRLVRWTAAPT